MTFGGYTRSVHNWNSKSSVPPFAVGPAAPPQIYSCPGGAVSRARLTWSEFRVAHDSKKVLNDGSEGLPGAG